MCLTRAVFDEYRPGLESKVNASIHMNTLWHMFRQRGGYSAFTNNPRLLVLIYYCSYSTIGYDLENYASTSRPREPHPFGQSDTTSPRYRQARNRLACMELVQFLEDAQSICNTQRELAAQSVLPHPARSFSRGSLLHQVITTTTPFAREPGSHHHGAYGMFVLIYLNEALRDFRCDADLTEGFVEDLHLRVVRNDLQKTPWVEILAQLLCCPSQVPALAAEHFKRLAKVDQLLSVAKRLSKQSWSRLRSLLIDCLALEGPRCSEEWKEDLLRELLAAPMKSLIAPAFATPLAGVDDFDTYGFLEN